MTPTARHPLDDLADNPIAQGNFLVGFVTALKTAGWPFPMIEGFIDAIIPAEDFMAKEAATIGPISKLAADMPFLPGIGKWERLGASIQDPGTRYDAMSAVDDKTRGALQHGASELTSLFGAAPNGVSNWLGNAADKSWNNSNIHQISEAPIGKAVARGMLDAGSDVPNLTSSLLPGGNAPGTPEYVKRLTEASTNPDAARSLYNTVANSQTNAVNAASAASIENPQLADKTNSAIADARSGRASAGEAASGVLADPIKNVIDQHLPNSGVSGEDIKNVISGRETPGGYVGNNWHRLLANQLKEKAGLDVDPETIKNWLPGLGIGAVGTLGSKMMGADWGTALGIGVGGGILGGNVYQGMQNGRSFGQQMGHVGDYLNSAAKKYVQPLFSPAQAPDQNAAVQTPAGAAPAAAPAPAADGAPAAPQTNAAAPSANAPAPAPAAATATATQQQAQQAGAAAGAQRPPAPGGIPPVAPVQPVPTLAPH